MAELFCCFLFFWRIDLILRSWEWSQPHLPFIHQGGTSKKVLRQREPSTYLAHQRWNHMWVFLTICALSSSPLQPTDGFQSRALAQSFGLHTALSTKEQFKNPNQAGPEAIQVPEWSQRARPKEDKEECFLPHTLASHCRMDAEDGGMPSSCG